LLARTDLFAELTSALSSALAPVPLEVDRSLDADDVVARELPLALLNHAGEESSPPDNAPRGTGLRHMTATVLLEVYGRENDDLESVYGAALSALEASRVSDLLERDPAVETEAHRAPDGAPYRALLITIRLPYIRS